MPVIAVVSTERLEPFVCKHFKQSLSITKHFTSFERFFCFMETKNIKKFIKRNWKLILGLIYLLSPLDIIPDVLPVIGISDDALVAILTLLMRYMDFKKELKMEQKMNDNIQEGEIVE